MAAVKPLTDSTVKTAKFDPETPANNTRRDGQGLELRISKTAKSWLFKYYRPADGKRTNMSFGQYPDVSLAMARQKRQEARALLAEGVDPQRHRDEQQEATRAASTNTFKAVAERWIELKRHSTTAAHCDAEWGRLDRFVFPALGGVPVDQIRAKAVIDTLRHLEDVGKLTTLRRICIDIKQILDLAVNSGLIDGANPCAAIGSAFKAPVKENMPSIEPGELPTLMAAISESGMEFTTRQALLWSLHTLVRPAEAAGTRWDEIDIEKGLWVIPAERMKMKREHTVPLTPQAIAILETIRPLSGLREHVFPHRVNPKMAMSKQSTNVALARMGFAGKLVAHGLRSLGATAMSKAGFSPDVIDSCLAHVVGGTTTRAYIRDERIEPRIPAMIWWSNAIVAAEQGIAPGEAGRRGLELVA